MHAKTVRRCLPLPCDFSNDIGGLNVQSAREVEQDRKRRYVLATFEEADVANVQVGQLSKRFLRQTFLRSYWW